MNPNIYDIASKLDEFMNDYDYYNYIDNQEDNIHDMLQNPEQLQGIIDYFKEAIFEMDETDVLYKEATTLLSELEDIAVQNYRNMSLPSLDEKLAAAESKNVNQHISENKLKADLEK